MNCVRPARRLAKVLGNATGVISWPRMIIRLENMFHSTTVEVRTFTTNREFVRFEGRRVRQWFETLCGIDGCDCRSDLRVTIDGRPATIRMLDWDAEDDQPGMEITLPGDIEGPRDFSG